MELATFGAGCFWGVEALFRQVEGVTDVAVGYTGGNATLFVYDEASNQFVRRTTNVKKENGDRYRALVLSRRGSDDGTSKVTVCQPGLSTRSSPSRCCLRAAAGVSASRRSSRSLLAASGVLPAVAACARTSPAASWARPTRLRAGCVETRRHIRPAR